MKSIVIIYICCLFNICLKGQGSDPILCEPWAKQTADEFIQTYGSDCIFVITRNYEEYITFFGYCNQILSLSDCKIKTYNLNGDILESFESPDGSNCESGYNDPNQVLLFHNLFDSYPECSSVCLTCYPKSNPLTFTVNQDTSVTIEHLMSESSQGCNLSFDRTQSKMEIPFKCSLFKGQTTVLDSIWIYDLVNGDSCLSYIKFFDKGYLVSNDELILHYPFDGEVNDVSGNNLNPDYIGTTLTSDRFGNSNSACYFAGSTTNYIRIPDNDFLNLDKGHTICLWVNSEDMPLPANHLISKGRDINSGSFHVGKWGYTKIPYTISNNSIISDNTWNHLAFAVDPILDSVYMYINGKIITSSFLPDFTSNNIWPLIFGRHYNGSNGFGGYEYQYKGKMDDIRIYKRKLSSYEIELLADINVSHPDYAPLMALYNSTNGSGWTNNTGWKEGAEGSSCDPCSGWHGIGCTNNRVSSINLDNNNLMGILPNLNLPYLTSLRCGWNRGLSGPIPDFSNTPLLTNLILYANSHIDTIPNFCCIPKLEQFSCGSNGSIRGKLPEFNNLGNVKTIDCQSNDLSGNIPSLTLCPKLGILFLSNNQFTGLLPNFNYLPLWGFSAWNNNLSGCFPDFICSNPSFSVHTNPLMPFQGDKTNFCNGESQIGAPCDDRNPNTTNDKINVDCTCRGCTSSNVTQSFSICKTETIIVGISTYTLPGTYVDTLQSSAGCDSILTTIITQKPNASFSQNIQICQGKTHTVESNTYNLPGVYIDTLQSSIGCDSIITTTITQKPNASLSQNIQICQGESISIGSNSYDSNGLYVDTLISRNGCDSIVRTILNVLQIQKTDDVIAICAGQSHQVGNKTYTQSGNYIDTLQSIFGCDSIISTFLTVRPSQNISFNAPDKICKGTEVNLSVNALGSYLWSDGQTSANISEILNANKTYRVSVTDQFGCLASSSISISVVEPKNIAIPIADTLTLCLKDTIIDPYSFLTQFDANGTWTLDENNISGQPFNLMELTERIHTLNYGFFQQAPCPDKDTSFTLVVKDCRIIDCSFILKDDSIKVNKNEASEISLTINDILPEEYIISIISVDPDVLESTSISDEGLYSFTVTGDFGDIVQVVYEICTPDCADCKQASLWIDNEALKDIIRTNIILPNTSGKNATLRFNDEEILKDSELYIFNRNGDRIFYMKDYDNSWNADGYTGGIYYYVLRYRSVDIKKTLTVMK